MANYFVKDPDAILDYTIDWTDWLTGSELIASDTWAVSSTGITASSTSKTTTAGTIWLSGGTAGQTYTVTNHIVTDSSRAEDRTISIAVLER
jgi:hypothetical protein